MTPPSPLVVGVVNNMQDSALKTTDRQFREMIAAASGDRTVRLRFFSLPDRPRGEAGRAYVAEHHEDISRLWNDHVDGLIVTGAEPHASAVVDEPYWSTLTKLVDWADAHTRSTIWSCLAAHAAVQYLDGVARHRFPDKLSGVFECQKAMEHPLWAGMPDRWRMPHSRSNTVAADGLVRAGYQLLSTSPEAGVDMFLRQGQSLFVFVQGHPEYDPGALLREFQRDVGRFLDGTAEHYPESPRGYFDDITTAAFAAFRLRALAARDAALLEDFPAADARARLVHTWREPAVSFYRNWLTRLAA